MNLEPLIQNELSHKEINKYHIPVHIYGILENGTAELFLQGKNRYTDSEERLICLAMIGEGGPN